MYGNEASAPGMVLGGMGAVGMQEMRQKTMAAEMRQPTLRESLEMRLERKKQEVADLEAALAALTPEIETAFNALVRVQSY